MGGRGRVRAPSKQPSLQLHSRLKQDLGISLVLNYPYTSLLLQPEPASPRRAWVALSARLG